MQVLLRNCGMCQNQLTLVCVVVFCAPRKHTHTFNGHFTGSTQVSRYQKDETNLDFTEATLSEWQWPQLGHMVI